MRELDKVELPAIPKEHDMIAYMHFRNQTTQAVVTASCRGQRAYDFIVEVERKETTFEDLAFCPEWAVSIDQKILTAVLGKVTGTLSIEINQEYELDRKSVV